MDERIEKAFEVANYMATLSNQRRIILEEYNQKLVHYVNGATFQVSPQLISFTKTMIDSGHTSNIAFVDSNNFPVIVDNVQIFFDSITSIYIEATNDYADKYAKIKGKRKIAEIIEL
jgi:hypothetical protein